MAMAIFGNVITACSWFGVNMLGVGLHSYGFMDKAFYALTGFIISQLVFMAICAAPARFWVDKTPVPTPSLFISVKRAPDGSPFCSMERRRRCHFTLRVAAST